MAAWLPEVWNTDMTILRVGAGARRVAIRSVRQQSTNMNTAFAGTQCRKGKRGFVCPHKLFPLGSVEPVAGVITCPLHGMRIDAATGVCLGPPERCDKTQDLFKQGER
jgi:hypothetical protein